MTEISLKQHIDELCFWLPLFPKQTESPNLPAIRPTTVADSNILILM